MITLYMQHNMIQIVQFVSQTVSRRDSHWTEFTDFVAKLTRFRNTN